MNTMHYVYANSDLVEDFEKEGFSRVGDHGFMGRCLMRIATRPDSEEYELLSRKNAPPFDGADE